MRTEVAKNIYWVGHIDWDIRDFHGYYTERGSTYNSYIILDEKTALIVAVKAKYAGGLVDSLRDILGGRRLDYVVCNHAEPDHSGGLVNVLLEAVPELASSAASPRAFVRGLRSDPALAVQLGLNPMLADASKKIRDVGQVAADADQDRLRVLLVLDQLEELWTDRTISDEARQQFLGAIEAVTQSGRVAAIATLRSDFYPQSQTALRRLKGEHGHFDLLPPGPAALQTVRTAKLRFAVRFGPLGAQRL